MMDMLQWIGCVFGVIGAWLLGRRVTTAPARAWGFGLFLASNACWIVWGCYSQVYGLLVMQSLFTITSIRGLTNNLHMLKK